MLPNLQEQTFNWARFRTERAPFNDEEMVVLKIYLPSWEIIYIRAIIRVNAIQTATKYMRCGRQLYEAKALGLLPGPSINFNEMHGD